MQAQGSPPISPIIYPQKHLWAVSKDPFRQQAYASAPVHYNPEVSAPPVCSIQAAKLMCRLLPLEQVIYQ